MACIHKNNSALKDSVHNARVRVFLDKFLIVVLVAAFLFMSFRLRFSDAFQTLLFFLAFAVPVVILLVRAGINDRSARVRQGGYEGEEAAISQLAGALPADYHIFPNLVLQVEGRESELDLVVVGPGGVSVVEVKNYSGELSGNATDKNLRHSNRSRSDTPYNPLLQVNTHLHRLRDHLNACGQRAWVNGMVYFVNPRLQVNITGTGRVPFFTADQFNDLVTELQSGSHPLSGNQVNGIVKVLTNPPPAPCDRHDRRTRPAPARPRQDFFR